MFASSCRSLTAPSPSVTTYPSTTDLSVKSWQWESTLDSCWRDSGNFTNSAFDDSVSEHSLSLCKTKIAWITAAIPDNKKSKKFSIFGLKKIVKKCSSAVEDSFNNLKWHRKYQIQRKQSIKFFNPVQLLNYTVIDDTLHPVDFVINYLCKTVQEVQEMRRNPQKIAHYFKGDMDAVLQDAAFTLSKMEQLRQAEKKINRIDAYSAKKQKHQKSIGYIDPRF